MGKTFIHIAMVALIIGFLAALHAFAPATQAAPAGDEVFSRRTPTVIAVEKTLPAVVNISTEYTQRYTVDPLRGSPFGADPFFREFFRPRTYTRTYESLGSGTLVDERGYLVTNQHVVSGANQLLVTLHDGTVANGVILAVRPEDDLAIVKLEAQEGRTYAPVRIGRSDDLMIGETVIAIGNPFRLDHTVTQGVVSAIDRVIQTDAGRELSGLIQSDAAINPGNSGGPLVNINAELIGINTAIRGRGAQNISFAMPVNKVRRFIDEAVHGAPSRFAALSLSVQAPGDDEARKLGIEPGAGVVVTDPGAGAAGSAGLRRWDVILGANGAKTPTEAALVEAVDFTDGEAAVFEVLRDGRAREIRVRIPDPQRRPLTEEPVWFGMQVASIHNATAARLGLPLDGGVVITEVLPRTPAELAKLQKDDYITGVYMPYPRLFPIRTVHDFRKAMDLMGESPERAVFEVTRPGMKPQPLELKREGA